MEPKASPVNLTDEELLELSAKNESKQVFDDDVYFFIATFNLQIGSNRVALDFLYSIYTRWSKKKISRQSFLARMKEVFASETLDFKTFMLLDSSVAAITKSMVELTVDPVLNNQKRASIHAHLEQFQTKFELQAAKTWVGEDKLWKLYSSWRQTIGKHLIKKEDFLEALDVLYISRFTKKNQREYALQMKEGIEQEKIPIESEKT